MAFLVLKSAASLLSSSMVLQKEGDELLAKGATEPSTGSIGYYSNVFVLLKH